MKKIKKVKDSTTETISFLIKKSLVDVGFWIYVQQEVKDSLVELIDNIDILGIEFKDAFVEGFKFEYLKRSLSNMNVKTDVPSAFQEFPEESYQCGIIPTKLLLGLDDWVIPQDSDVWAVFLICEQIRVLQESGFFDKFPERKDADRLISMVFNNLENARKKTDKEIKNERKS